MSFGVDPRNPLEYARINYFLIPGVSYNREPISGVGGDYDFQIETIWRVGKAPNGDPPITGTEGDQWILTKKTGGYAQGNQNPTWQKFIPGGVASLFTLSDTADDTVEPSGPGDTPPNNIQLYSSDGTILIVSDAANNRIDFTVNGGQAVDEFATDVGGPVFDNAGVVNFTGATTTYTNGSVANTLRTEVQGTNHALFVGRGSQTPAANLAVGATNTVLLGNTGADPSFGTVPNAALANSTIGLTNGNNITVTSSPIALGGSASIAVTGTTNHAVQLGNSSGSLSSITPPSNAYAVLRAQGTNPSTTDPQWITSGTSFDATFTNFNGSYISQAGRYLRFGNMVFLQINMDWTGNTAPGDMTISNCPFVFGSALSHYIGSVLITDVTLPVLTIQVICDGSNATTNLDIKAVLDNAPSSKVQMNAAGTLSLTLMYFAVSL